MNKSEKYYKQIYLKCRNKIVTMHKYCKKVWMYLEDIGEEDSGNNDGSFGIDMSALLV